MAIEFVFSVVVVDSVGAFSSLRYPWSKAAGRERVVVGALAYLLKLNCFVGKNRSAPMT